MDIVNSRVYMNLKVGLHSEFYGLSLKKIQTFSCEHPILQGQQTLIHLLKVPRCVIKKSVTVTYVCYHYTHSNL